jgi:dolichol kinase
VYPIIALLVLGACVEIATRVSKALSKWVYHSPYSPISYLTRPEEKSPQDIHAAFSGLCALLIIYLLFHQFFIPAGLILAFADPAARIIGTTFGKRRIGKTQKTYAGASACFLISLAILLFSGYALWISVAVGLLTSVIEVVSIARRRYLVILQDNFLIPMGVASALFLLEMMSI